MTAAHKVVDVAFLLDRPPEDAPTTGVVSLHQSEHAQWSLLRVAAGARWEAPPVEGESSFVVLEGNATFNVEGWRRTLGSGHLMHVAGGHAVSVDNDGNEPLSALLTVACPAQAAAAG